MVPFHPSTVDPVRCAVAHGLSFPRIALIAVVDFARTVHMAYQWGRVLSGKG